MSLHYINPWCVDNMCVDNMLIFNFFLIFKKNKVVFLVSFNCIATFDLNFQETQLNTQSIYVKHRHFFPGQNLCCMFIVISFYADVCTVSTISGSVTLIKVAANDLVAPTASLDAILTG